MTSILRIFSTAFIELPTEAAEKAGPNYKVPAPIVK